MVNPRSKARIEARIRERVAYAIEFELKDPRSTFITLTRVEASDDLSIAKVFYSVYGTPGDKSRAAHMLESASGFLRKQLGRVLRTRRIPQLRWIYDDSVEFQAEMERKIRTAIEHDREVHPGAHSEIETPAEEPTDPTEREYLEFLEAQEEEDGQR
jgi:ribosome-binding factor A